MKRYVSIIFMVLLLGSLFCPLTARADVIYQPMDSFYDEHRDECDYVDRSYTINGPDGTVTIYESPVSATVEAKLENGEQVYVSYSYEDSAGIVWACCEVWGTDTLGWVPMDCLEAFNGPISLSEEVVNQFVAEEGTLGEKYLGKTVFFWQYPGRSIYGCTELVEEGDTELPGYDTVYVDENGTRWGRCANYKEWSGYWMNLDDPTLEPTENITDDYASSDATGELVEEIVPGEAGNLNLWLILAIGAVVAIAGLMSVKLKGKKK